jgi:hypothetical protein
MQNHLVFSGRKNTPHMSEKPSTRARPFVLTERDRQILLTIWKFEGLMKVEQIRRVFGMGTTQVYDRLGKMKKNEYISQEGGFCWLKTKGAQVASELMGYGGELSKFSHVSRPNLGNPTHPITLNNLRIQAMESIAQFPGGQLVRWVSDYEFHRTPDVVEYQVTLRRGKTRTQVQRTKEVTPDGYCEFILPISERQRIEVKLLWELDLGTETGQGRFSRDKVFPLKSYLESEAYRKRFGEKGIILVPTTTPARLADIKQQTEQAGGGGYFYFTLLDEYKAAKNVFTDPIWRVEGSTARHAILDL